MFTYNFRFIGDYICRESAKNLNKHLSEAELKSFSNNDYYYLSVIYHLGKPNFSQVAKELNLTKSAISILIKKFVKMGLIEKVQSIEDKRIYYISLTEKGNNIIAGDEALYLELADQIKELLQDEEQYRFVDELLTRIVGKLKSQSQGKI